MKFNELKWDEDGNVSNPIIRKGDGKPWLVWRNKDGTFDVWTRGDRQSDDDYEDINNLDLVELAVLLIEFTPYPER